MTLIVSVFCNSEPNSNICISFNLMRVFDVSCLDHPVIVDESMVHNNSGNHFMKKKKKLISEVLQFYR